MSEPFLPPLVRDLPAGVARARLPTPFAAGAVGCYLLTEPPVTVVDPGTVTPASLERLDALLAGAGCSLHDVEQVVVTHAHPDHFGAAAWVARRADAPIIAGRAEVPVLRDEQPEAPRSALLTAIGVPTDLVDALGSLSTRAGTSVEWVTDDVEVRPVDDGDTITAGGRELTAHVTAGHAPGHLSLWSAADRVLFSGDHLLPRVVPLPALVPSGTGAGHRPSLREHVDSLPLFVALDPAVVLPGHGEAFTRVDVLERWLLARCLDRCSTVRDVVAELGRPTPFEVAQRLLWQAEGSRLVRGVAEVLGHLDLLELDGTVVADTDGPAVRYRVAS